MISYRAQKLWMALIGLGLSVTATAATYNFNINGGYREGDLDFELSTPATLTSGDFSDISFDEVQMAQIKTEVSANLDFGLFIAGSYTFGWISDGDMQDSDLMSGDVDDTDVRDASFGLGYEFKIYDPNARGYLHFIPQVGYSYHEQNVRVVDGVGTTGALVGLDSSYETEWDGAWLGLRTTFEFPVNLDVFFNMEYHWADFDAEGDWNLRTELTSSKSFEQEADGNGWILNFGINWAPRLHEPENPSRWYVRLNFTYEDWWTDEGTNRFFFADGTTSTSELSEVNWESFAANMGVGIRF